MRRDKISQQSELLTFSFRRIHVFVVFFIFTREETNSF